MGIGGVEGLDGDLRAAGGRWWGSVGSRASTAVCGRLGPVVGVEVVEGLDGGLCATGSRWWIVRAPAPPCVLWMVTSHLMRRDGVGGGI